MPKDDERQIDNLEEEYIEPSDVITPQKNAGENSKQNADANKLNLEDIRTAGF
tara:strand:+ start:77 stop:235 length:159 start_codon:yes stop_codon:yes gene_type:complete